MHSHSQSTILNTRDHMQAVVEMFMEHVEFCSEPFKEEILKKVNELKGRDSKLLTNFVGILSSNIFRLKSSSNLRAQSWFR